MTTELYILAWTLVLALVQILLPGMERNRQTGLKWNAGPRDEPPPPPTRLGGRLQRAQANLYETLPLFAAAILMAHVAGRDGPLTIVGAWLYLIARLLYLPIYAYGVPVIRSIVWGAGLLGFLLVLFAILTPL